MPNLQFYYKNIGRQILALKVSDNKFNAFNIEHIKYLSLYFSLINIIDLNSMSICSCIYFFQYYFGITPFFSNYSHKFHLNIHYYNFFIQYTFSERYYYFPFYFFINDIYFLNKKRYITFVEELTYVDFKITDMTFFIEKKNLLGFYYLKHNINFKIGFTKNILYLFKLKF